MQMLINRIRNVITTHHKVLQCEMAQRLPPINRIGLQDGTSKPLHLTRRRTAIEKLFVPRGVQFTVSRGKLGDVLYKPTTDFVNKGPSMHVMMTSYNCLHDRHLRHYFQGKDALDKLHKENLITEDNEVLCCLKEFNTYEEYLRGLKLVENRTYDEKQRGKMRKFMKYQEKGLIPRNVSLAEMAEFLLEQGAQSRRQLVQPRAGRLKNRQRKRIEVEKDSRQSEEDFYTEMYLLTWRAEDRSRLMMYERELRHEQNKERYLRDLQKEKNRKKQAIMAQKCAIQQRKLLEKLKMSEGPGRESTDRSKLQDGHFHLPPLGDSQHPLRRRTSMEQPVAQSDRALRHERKRMMLDSIPEESLDEHAITTELQGEMFWEAPQGDQQSHLPPSHLPPVCQHKSPGTNEKRAETQRKCAIL